MAVVMAIGVVLLLQGTGGGVIMGIRIRGMMVVIGVVIVEARRRSFIVKMTMQTLYRGPGKLDREEKHEKDRKQTTHRFIVSESD